MTRARADRIRRRPDVIRYFFLVLSNKGTIHTGTTHARLATIEKEYGIANLLIADVATGVVKTMPIAVEDFLEEWRNNYDDDSWNVWDYVKGKGSKIV